MRYSIFFFLGTAATLVSSIAIAHITDDYSVREFPPHFSTRYAGHSQEMSKGDIYFPDSLPNPAGMSHAEQAYIGAFLPGPNQVGYRSWRDALIEVLDAYYGIIHQIPVQLSPAVIAEAFHQEVSEVDPLLLEFLKSPVTNEYPRLDRREFSRGDMYVQRLTKSDIARIAPYNPSLKYTFVDRQCWSPSANGWVDCGASEVFYVRKYGDAGIIDYDVLYMVFPLS